jgi:hypothetical protein
MCPAIDNPTRCEIHAVIFFLHTKNMSTAEIHYELCSVYGQIIMSERTVRQWCRMFKVGRTNVDDGEQSGRPYVVSAVIAQSVHQKICERWRFAISDLLCEFPQISCTPVYKIITVRLG